MRNALRVALLGSLIPLAGCMTTGTNMHNDFACRAPNGTCAPMSVIDSKAVAGLGATTMPVGGIVDPAMPREGRVVTASSDGTPPGRTADRVLRIVFPAHIDASGIYHDETSAHAVVERGGWTDGLTGGRPAVVTSAAIAAAATPDASSSKLASLDDILAARGQRKPDVATSVPAPARVIETPQAVRTPVSLRSASAIDLREAAAAATAGPVGGLDPNFDTPDVSAIEVDDTAPATGTCVAYHMVRWHGHAYRRPFKAPCPVVVAAADVRSPTVAVQLGTTAALNRASIDRAIAPVAVASDAAAAAPPAPTPAPLSPPATSPTAMAPYSASAPVRFPRTDDRTVAAARVSAMAAPVIAAQVRAGRDAAHAATPDLGAMFAGAGVAQADAAPR